MDQNEIAKLLTTKRAREDTTHTRISKAALKRIQNAADRWDMLQIDILEYLAYLVDVGEIPPPFSDE